jgi:hypothetical protein
MGELHWIRMLLLVLVELLVLIFIYAAKTFFNDTFQLWKGGQQIAIN